MKYLILVFTLITSIAFGQVPEPEKKGRNGNGFWTSYGGLAVLDFNRNNLPSAGFSTFYNLKQLNDNMSLTLGSHICGTLSFSNVGSLVMIDAPILAHFNIGYGTNPNTRLPIGFVGGAGLGLDYINIGQGLSQFSYGPMLDGGLKLILANRIIYLRASYMVNFVRGPFFDDMVTIGLYFGR